MNSILDTIRSGGAKSGLNLVAATPADRYDGAVKPDHRVRAIAPGTRSIIVIGNGGGAFWAAFREHCKRDSDWMSRDNPLDDFTRMVVERDLAASLAESRIIHNIIYPFMNDGPTLNFMEAGKAAGLCAPSILGVMVHPIYGPWVAFRAAILLDQEIDAPGEAREFDPCPSCSARTCISACPAGAVSFTSGWDIPRCLTHRVEVEPDCAPRCHARVGCVLGPEYRYQDDELAYHQMRSLRAMRPFYAAHIKAANQKG